MALLLKTEVFDRLDFWVRELTQRVPDLDVRVWPDVGPPEDIEYALVWKPEPGDLKRYPNLKVILSMGAGVDHILADPELPRDIPMTRIVDTNMTENMRDYVLTHILKYHRRQPEYDAQQAERVWRELDQPSAAERRVGILGLGELGGAVAAALKFLGFTVAGWSRGPKSIAGVECFHGADGLEQLLGGTEILVCLLPLTAETRGIINARTLAALPRGASLINAARGGHVVKADLIAALDSGHIAGATLDVFDVEPLPEDDPLWAHPKVTITPHIAAITDPLSAAAQVAENILRHRRGDSLINLVDTRRGY